jgi:hypothetical protein
MFRPLGGLFPGSPTIMLYYTTFTEQDEGEV